MCFIRKNESDDFGSLAIIFGLTIYIILTLLYVRHMPNCCEKTLVFKYLLPHPFFIYIL